MSQPTAIDLFCGAGGLSLGLKQAGFKVLAAVDLDPLAIKSFKANHRKTKVISGMFAVWPRHGCARTWA